MVNPPPPNYEDLFPNDESMTSENKENLSGSGNHEVGANEENIKSGEERSRPSQEQ